MPENTQSEAEGKTVLKKLQEGIMDLSEAEVLTFQGEIKGFITNSGNDGSLIAWKQLLEKAKATGEVQLMAATQVMIDGDTLLFMAPNIPADLRAAHNAAVVAAQEYRKGLIEAFADILNIKPTK